MSYQNLRFQKEDYMMVINIDSSDDSFRIAQLSSELTELCDEIAWDEEIRVVILTGAEEKSFSIATNFIEKVPGSYEEDQITFWSLAESISKLDQPVIAAINGNAIGQGLELILACDMRIAIEKSHFGLPHIKTGLIPWDGGTQRLSRLAGRGKALQMILTGEIIDALEAHRIGLVNKVVRADELMTAAMDKAKEMVSKGPIALKYAKEAIYKGMDLTLEQGLHLEADLYLLLHTAMDRIEGIKAFKGKRVPKFEGR